MKRISVVAMLFAASVLAMTAACDAPEDEPTATPEAPLVLRGIFVADEDERAGGIDELELRGARYRLLADGCNDIECEEQGRFAHDAAQAALHLTPDRSGITYTLPFTIDEVEPAEDAVGASDEEAFAPVLGVIADEKHGAVSPTETQKLLVKRNVRLVRRGRLLNRRYVQRQGGCSTQQIAAAKADCRDRVCAGRQSRGLNYCSVSGGRGTYSCACSAGTTGGGGACRSAQTAFLRCADDASGRSCGRMPDCRGAFMDSTDSLNGCTRPTIRGGCAGY